MNNLKLLFVCSFLLFTSTGIQSNTGSKIKNVKHIPEIHEYTIPEFQKLEESIQKQIQLTIMLDSLSKIKK